MITYRAERVRRSEASGYTVLELMVSLVLFLACLLGVLNALSDSMYHYTVQGTYAVMQMDARKALEAISRDLRMGGRIRSADNKIEYPYTFVNGGPTASCVDLSGAANNTFTVPAAHAPAGQHLSIGAPGFGDNREIGFKIPWDVDGDGQPTAAATGDIEWSPSDVSYTIVSAANGVNQLQRWYGGKCTDVIADYVERITFDTVRTDPTIDWNGCVVTVYMAKPTSRGVWLQTQLSTIVKMRNTNQEAEPASAFQTEDTLLTWEATVP